MTEHWSLPFLQRLYRRSKLFEWRLRRPQCPAPTHWQAQDPWRGKPALGQPLVGGQTLQHSDKAWHQFTWLRDMREFGGSQARTHARRMVINWINQNKRWSALAWHPETIAERLKMMVFLWGWFGQSASLDQQQAMIASMQSQYHCLIKDWKTLNSKDARAIALSAMIVTNIFLDEDAEIATPASAMVATIADLIFADGCHVSRRVDYHMTLLQVLIETRAALAVANGRGGSVVPATKDALAFIEDSIILMGSVGRMWRHGDGILMGIAGSLAVDLEVAEQVLNHARPNSKITHHASDGGFIRVASGRSLLLMNTAAPSWSAARAAEWGSANDGGALAIEFSSGQHRIVVNAGQIEDTRSLTPKAIATREALASTAAHSTLTLDNINSADIGISGGNRQATSFNVETGPAEGGILAVSSHDGYDTTHGIIHTRRVFLATGGADLRGEDVLTYTGSPAGLAKEAVIRFHLHPKITPVVSQKGDIILRLPGTAAPWAFRASGGDANIEDSIVMMKDGIQKTVQITLTADINGIRQQGSHTIRWGFRRQ